MIIFAGGGSGGHIFPALAIAEFTRPEPALFVCSDRPLDSDLLRREGVEFRTVPAKPISLRPKGLWRFLRGWGPSVRIGRQLIREAKAKGQGVRVVATGGFVAAPIARAAKAEGVPLILVNLDAVPGKANRLIARHATRLISAVPIVGPGANLAWEVVPPIVRESTRTTLTPQECRRSLGLDPDLRTLLITGGSQGAVSLNRILIRAAREHAAAFHGWQVIHQCGRAEEPEVRAAYQAAGIRAEVRAFFEQMGHAWRAADLAVSRAGAGGVAEAWAFGVPTIFLPNPYHRDEHQRHNAARLVKAGAALVLRDHIDSSLNNEAVDALATLMNDPARRANMRNSFRTLGPPDGAAAVARQVREL